MRTILITSVILLVLTGCRKEQEQLEKLNDDLRIYFVENLQDSTSTLDSFKVVKIDSITNQILLRKQSSILQNELDQLVMLYKFKADILSSISSRIEILKSIDASSVDIELNSKKRELDKANKIKYEIDTIMVIISNINSKISITDSIKAIGYVAQCAYQIRLKDRSVKQDTAYITLNKNKDIVNQSDFLNVPYRVDYSMFK